MIKYFCQKVDFPIEATEYLSNELEKLLKDKDIQNSFYCAMDDFFLGSEHKFDEILSEISKKTRINRYTLDMLFILFCERPIHYIYNKNNVGDEIYYDTLADLLYKLNECKKIHNIWGTFVIHWYKYFVDKNIVKLGRLQYEKREIKYDYKNFAKKGDIVLSCHIPSCGPLIEKEIMDSLKLAYNYYNYSGNMILTCSSWLTYAPHYTLFPENSNLRKFYDLFDVIANSENENVDFWRIFNTEKTDDYSNLPQETKLQINFLNYLKAGNKMGEGYGVLVFDGEKIINK